MGAQSCLERRVTSSAAWDSLTPLPIQSIGFLLARMTRAAASMASSLATLSGRTQ